MSVKPQAISIANVSKDFYLPHQRVGSIKNLFIRPLQTLRDGKDIELQHALKDISFDIKEGEFFGIVGRNGSGKSTLLKILAKIYQPTTGTVTINGKLVPFIELGVGFNPELTGKDNVYLNGALLGFSNEEIEEMYDSIISFAELEKFMDQKLKNYSSGMQVRLAFSLATRANADILLIDEVLAVGDADFQKKCFEYFSSLKKAKKTVVFVSHDMEAVREYCDRAMLIEDAKIVEIGAAEHVAARYKKLFSEENNTHIKENKQENNRWGSQALKYTKTSVRVLGEAIEIEANVSADEDISGPLLGFTIKDNKGRAITGTNTKIVKKQVEIVKKGAQAHFVWKIPNIFVNGRYEVDITAENTAGSITYDWWESAASFVIEKETSSPYVVSPNITFAEKPDK